MEGKKKNVEVSNHTKQELRNIGKKGMTYDEVVIDLIEHIKTCDEFWVDRL